MKSDLWNNCQKVYDAQSRDFCFELSDHMQEQYSHYVQRLDKSEPEYNVWFDLDGATMFGCDQTYLNSVVPNQAAFLDTKYDFLSNKKYGLPSVERYSYFANSVRFVGNQDGFCELTEEVPKYRGSSILIIGGGPSTSKYNLLELSKEYDYVWSCNHFYKNPEITKLNIDLFYVNAKTHMKIPALKEYVLKNNTICAADTSISRPPYVLRSFKKNSCKTLLFGTRMFLTAGGASAKLISLAVILEAKKIAIVGMDGWTKEQIETSDSGPHAFDVKKRLNISANFDFNHQRKEMVMFWDYYLANNVEFQNLGEIYEHNASRDISTKMFPLREEKE